MIQDIADFHAKFEVHPPTNTPALLTGELLEFRLKFMQEELDETREAAERGDLPAFADGLIDLMYVALGTLHLARLPTQALWDAVHAANMAKVRARREEDSKRGSIFDVVKPEGWQPPDIHAILMDHGWEP